MKIINQYIVKGQTILDIQVLFECENDKWFCTSTGAFGQRDMSIMKISKYEAQQLLNTTE
jgi:hypothetical protein